MKSTNCLSPSPIKIIIPYPEITGSEILSAYLRSIHSARAREILPRKEEMLLLLGHDDDSIIEQSRTTHVGGLFII